jgi:hypothetical protein
MILKNKVETAKRLLLSGGCTDCFCYHGVFNTAKVINFPKGMPLSEEDNQKIFLGAIGEMLPRRECGLKIDFQKGNEIPIVEIPEKGYCNGWLSKDTKKFKDLK